MLASMDWGTHEMLARTAPPLLLAGQVLEHDQQLVAGPPQRFQQVRKPSAGLCRVRGRHGSADTKRVLPLRRSHRAPAKYGIVQVVAYATTRSAFKSSTDGNRKYTRVTKKPC